MSEVNNGEQMSSVIKEIESETEKILVLLVDDQAMVAEGVRRMLATDPTIAFHYVSDPTQADRIGHEGWPDRDLARPCDARGERI